MCAYNQNIHFDSITVSSSSVYRPAQPLKISNSGDCSFILRRDEDPAFLLLLITLSQVIFNPIVSVADSAYLSPYGIETTTSCQSTASDDLIPVRREVYGNGRIFDITHQLIPDMPPWGLEDGLGQFLWLPNSMKNGSLAYNSEMKLPTHTGTHIDAPGPWPAGHVFDYYFDAGFDVDTLDLEDLNGPALLVDVPRDKNLTADVMQSLHFPKGVKRVFFRTLNTDRCVIFIRWLIK